MSRKHLLACLLVVALLAGATGSLPGNALAAQNPGSAASAPATQPPGGYVPMAAHRVLDTRQGLGGGGLGTGERRELMVVGVGGVPASGVRAVAISVNVDRPTRSGSLWVGPAGAAHTGSAMRVVHGASSSATLLVPVGANGRLVFEQGFTRRLHVVVELLGWFADGPGVSPGGYVPVAAQRVVDTRQGLGGGGLAPAQRREVTVVGVGGVPATGVRAVTVSITLDRPAHSGSLLVDPAGAGQAGPTVRFRQGKITSVTLLVPVGLNGRVVLHNSSTRRLHLTMDVLGWFADGSGVTPGGYVPAAAQHLLETRQGLGGGGLRAGQRRALTVVGVAGVPATGVRAVAVSVVVDRPARSGTLQVGPAGALQTGWTVRFARGRISSAVLLVPVGADGRLVLEHSTTRRLHLTVELLGWFADVPASGQDSTAPEVAFTTPADGARLDPASGSIVVAGTASDIGSGVDRVELTSKGIVVGTAELDRLTQPATWQLETSSPASGPVEFTATAYDRAGNQAAASVHLTITLPAASEPVLDPDTVVLTQGQRAALTVVAPDELRFAQSVGLDPGEVVASAPTDAAPQGFLRRVTSTRLDGMVTVVQTEPAALTDAIRQGEIEIARPLTEHDVAQPSVSRSNGLAPQALGQSFRSRGQAVVKGVDVTTEAEVVANAEFAFDLKLDIKLSVVTKWRFGPPEVYVDHFKTALELKTGPTVEISAKGTITGSKNVTLPGFKLRPIVVNIGPVPVTFTPELANTLKLQASATAAASSLKAALDITASLGVEYRHSSGWKPISSVNVNRRLDPFSPAATALDAKASIQSTFTVFVWETVGPAITGTPHARVHTANSNWAVYVGFEATAGVHFKVPVIDRRIAGYDVSMFKREWLLAGATGPPPTTTSTTSTTTTTTTPVPSSRVAAWGYNGTGGLGDGTTNDALTPVEVHGLTGVTAVAARGLTSLALRRDRTVWAWGANSSGALGNGSTDDASAPVQVRGLTGATAIDTGGLFSMALRGDGTVWAWGFNGDGELGNGTTTDALTPVQVRGLTGVTAIAAGARYSMALRSDGTVWAWGRNPAGQLGNGTTTNASTPVQVRGLTGVIAIAAGYSHSLAVRGDGTVWAWGDNGDGELGNGTTTDALTPVQVRSLTGVTTIAAGATYSMALRSDGTVWAWGDNHFGQLGDGTRTSASIPVRVSGLMGVTTIAAGASHSLAVRGNGTIWAWGHNGLGALGTGTRTDVYTPVQVPGLSPR